MNLSLGPLLYYWSRDDVLAFYEEAKTWPVARVYLGESVCSRRHLLRLSDWLALAAQLAGAPAGMEPESFAYGRLPLAYSARCFTARHYNLPKDDCQFRCLDHPDGLALSTREGAPFLTLNGIQTQSAGVYTLIGELPALRDLGVASLRLSPQSRHMERVIDAFQSALAGAAGAADRLARVMPGPAVDGYWHGRAGLEHSAVRQT